MNTKAVFLFAVAAGALWWLSRPKVAATLSEYTVLNGQCFKVTYLADGRVSSEKIAREACIAADPTLATAFDDDVYIGS